MFSKRLFILFAGLVALTVVLFVTRRGGPETPEPRAKLLIDPPLVITRKPQPLKLYQGSIPPSGAAELSLSVHMH